MPINIRRDYPCFTQTFRRFPHYIPLLDLKFKLLCHNNHSLLTNVPTRYSVTNCFTYFHLVSSLQFLETSYQVYKDREPEVSTLFRFARKNESNASVSNVFNTSLALNHPLR